MANARGYSPYQRGPTSNQPRKINRRSRRGGIPTQANLKAARARELRRQQRQARLAARRGASVAVYRPGTRPPTRTGRSRYVGPSMARQIRQGSSRRIRGASVQNRRQTPKTYI